MSFSTRSSVTGADRSVLRVLQVLPQGDRERRARDRVLHVARSLVADRFWLGRTDSPSIQLNAVKKMLTGVHGKLLSRQSLLTFHDQGREGIDRVERTPPDRGDLLRGTDRQVLLFFIPSGEVWDSGYFDRLSDLHRDAVSIRLSTR